MANILNWIVGIGIIATLTICVRVLTIFKYKYDTLEAIHKEKFDALRVKHESQLSSMKLEIKKHELVTTHLETRVERLSSMLNKRIVEVGVAAKYFMAYDDKDISPQERTRIAGYIYELEEIVDSTEGNDDASRYLIQLHSRFGSKDRAIFYQKQLTNKQPANYNRWRDLAHLYHSFGHFNEAIECSQEVLKLNPSCHQAIYEIGVCYQMLGSNYPRGSSSQKENDKKAIEHYRRAISVEPEYITARIMLCSALHRAGEKNEVSELLAEIDDRYRRGEFVHRELYAYACLQTIIGSLEKAAGLLIECVGKSDSIHKTLLINSIRNDPDLNQLRESPHWQSVQKHFDKILREHIA